MLNRRWHARIGLAILGMFWSAILIAMPSQIPPSSSGNDEAEHEALRKLKAVYEDAVRNNRIDALSGSFHSDFHGVMVTGRAVNSFADVQQFWRDIRGLIGEGGSYTTTLNPERSVILGDLALARGTTDDVVKTNDGHEYRFTTLWTATLQKEGGSWKIRSVQGTMDPIANPFVREFEKRLLVRVSSGVGVASLVIGALIGAVWQRRRSRRKI
jgi:ketosteroid isomerase-like protein